MTGVAMSHKYILWARKGEVVSELLPNVIGMKFLQSIRAPPAEHRPDLLKPRHDALPMRLPAAARGINIWQVISLSVPTSGAA